VKNALKGVIFNPIRSKTDILTQKPYLCGAIETMNLHTF
jgi:hypothetical protein